MLEGLDWQPILIAAIGIMSLVNGLSVFQNFRADRPDVRVEPVYDGDWMWWSELIDTSRAEPIRRYIVVGNLGRSNHGRRPTSISDTQLRIRLRNLRTATSPLYDIPQPEIELSHAGAQRLPVMKPGPDPFDYKPMMQPGESVAGIHCFLFGMYGSDLWTPKSENGVLDATIELEGGFGNCFKSKLSFGYVEFEELVKRFPTLEPFVLKNLEQNPG